ncbi:transposase [Burkholderia territorii]|uniref:Transposase n=1 Tax=Burkholderia territorii TaxID=1503055 RepID=A0A105VC52_9BURK|nr:recombinase family protein [Burkholderia territorii]KVV45133.1 transposase [Burkholderia territorii]KVX32069.1 transposase [Burkholderia territorii]
MSKGKRIGYIRVSTVDQSTERQLEGVDLDKVFTDKASGKDTERPQLQAALDYLRDGDTLMVHSMDRLARNTEDLLRMVRELTERGVTVQFVKDSMTFSADKRNPQQQLMMTMLAAFAQFERSLIRERQREGIAIAKANGVYKGRKPSLSPEQVSALRQRAASGETKAAIARDLGISRETLYQYLRQERAGDTVAWHQRFD